VVAGALAATKQKPKQRRSLVDYITDVKVLGEIGREDAEILRRIMEHACTATGISVKEAGLEAAPKVGEFYHIASRDQSSPPGCLRILLRDREEVRKIHAALHGQTIQVGSDAVAMAVQNAALQLETSPGNGRR